MLLDADCRAKLADFGLARSLTSVRKFKMLQTRCIAALSEKYTDFYFELLPEIELDMEELEELQEKQEKQQMENKNGREDK